MISVFAPAYDLSTMQLLSLARRAFGRFDVVEACCAQDANRAPLLRLSAASEPLIVFSHGDSSHICGQGGGPALELSDASSVSTPVMLVLACRTASALGPQIAAGGVTRYIGFEELVTVPFGSSQALDVVVGVMEQMIDKVATSTAASHAGLHASLMAVVERAQDALDHFFWEEAADVLSSMQFLRDCQKHLVVLP